MPPSLVALSGRLQGRTFDLTSDGLAIGRHPSNDLAIPDAAVSRHHCALRRTASGWRVADLDSRHGTFLNGRPVREETLRHGDVLAIGESTFLAVLEEPAGEEAGTGEDVELEAGTEILLRTSRRADLAGRRGWRHSSTPDAGRHRRAGPGLVARQPADRVLQGRLRRRLHAGGATDR